MSKESGIPIEVSARHIHLSREDVDALFGQGYELKKVKDLSQGVEFAAEETVNIEINGKVIENVRVVGEIREYTQFECTASDAYFFKTDIPLRISGDVEGTPGMKLIGKAGEAVKDQGAIIARRHIHASPEEAESLGLKDREEVNVKCGEERAVTFHKAVVRIEKGYRLALHIDVDEANAAGVKGGEAIIV